MWVIYFLLLAFLLINMNVYLVWIFIEFIFLYFLLIILTKEIKRIGLIIYFFFQGCISIILFFRIIFFLKKLIFLVLMAKLGVFPFFFWIIVVRIKLDYWGNIFVLGFQKIRSFWFLWLLNDIHFLFFYLFCYLRMFFVIISLIIVSDMWLFLIYRSIANTGILILRVYGTFYIVNILLYLLIVILIIWLMKVRDSFNEIIFVIFFFLVIPPFILFFIKLYIIRRIDFFLKLGFYLRFLDVLVLFYYFSFIFIKILLLETSNIIYFINFFIIFVLLLFRNCVTMTFFDKSQGYWDFIFYYWNLIWFFRS